MNNLSTSHHRIMKSPVITTIILLLLFIPTIVVAKTNDELSVLRQQLNEQKRLIEQQQTMLNQQQQTIEQQTKILDKLSQRLDALAGTATNPPSLAKNDTASQTTANEKTDTSPPSTTSNKTETVQKPAAKNADDIRDRIGDMNNESVVSGEFPGSFKIPGTGDVSLGIGGFVRTVALVDSNAEAMGADFLPANLGTARKDKAGSVAFDATLTRLNLDARAPMGDGKVRGYIEHDLNQRNDGSLGIKMRHAYGTWQNAYGTLLAGHTWSTFMDTKILPEGVTEPTVNGAVFTRQAQVRWSQPLDQHFTLHTAVEDPNSSDVFSNQASIGHTNIPDVVVGIEYNAGNDWHLRTNGIYRDIKVELPQGEKDSKTAWGVSLTGHKNFFEKDKLRFGGVYGQSLGRYLLGIQSTDGGAINPATNQLNLRNNWGALASYEHHWSKALRSTVMGGHAYASPLAWQAGSTLHHTSYAAANLVWQVSSFLSVGVEYDYGIRENKDHTNMDNHRVILGVQMF